MLLLTRPVVVFTLFIYTRVDTALYQPRSLVDLEAEEASGPSITNFKVGGRRDFPTGLNFCVTTVQIHLPRNIWPQAITNSGALLSELKSRNFMYRRRVLRTFQRGVDFLFVLCTGR